MTWNSGPMRDGEAETIVAGATRPRTRTVDAFVTVAELAQAYEHTCRLPGPAFLDCARHQGHPNVCAALSTDSAGVPIVVCWWPAGMFPVGR